LRHPSGDDHLAVVHRPQRRDQLDHGRVLREEAAEPDPHRLPHDVDVVERGHGDDADVGEPLEDLPTDVQAAHVGKADVDDHQIGLVALDELQRLIGRGRDIDDLDARVLEEEPDRLTEEPVVINDQNADGGPPFPPGGPG
jgi:hypothetical protein